MKMATFRDWLELYNAGPDAVNFDDWHLTDDVDDLQKWAFPAQELSPGNFLIVYLSDKDRAGANNPLHANFKLTTGGEYLALTQATGPNTINVVSEFAPEYPAQFTDISYGFGQTVSVTEVSLATDAAKFFVPTNSSLGAAWTKLNFNDSSWSNGTAALGYQKTVPGFTVQDAKSNSNNRESLRGHGSPGRHRPNEPIGHHHARREFPRCRRRRGNWTFRRRPRLPQRYESR